MVSDIKTFVIIAAATAVGVGVAAAAAAVVVVVVFVLERDLSRCNYYLKTTLPSSLNYYHFQIKIHYGLVIRHHLLQIMMAMQLVVLGPFGNKCVCLQ